MFERALIRRIEGTDVDLGLLAETIFFYGKTQILLDHAILTGLSKILTLDELKRITDSNTVQFSFRNSNIGVVSGGTIRTHQFAEFFVGRKEKTRLSVAENIERTLSHALEDNPAKAKALKKFFVRNTEQNKQPADDIPNLARADVADKNYLVSAVRLILKHLVPEYSPPQKLEFELYDTGRGYAAVTNLDYGKINALYHERVSPKHSTISTEYLLSFIQDARAETYFAANYSAELVTIPLLSDLIRLKHFEFLRRRDQNQSQIDLFKDVVLDGFPSIREAVNSGAKSFSEFLDLIDEAKNFRSWLQAQNPDANILREYQKASTQNTWADKLPTKGVRFAVATGLGLIGEALMPSGMSIAAGIGVGAADTFLLDKIIKGWRPNQFVETRLRSFVTDNKDR